CLSEKRPLILKPPSIEPHFGRIFVESVLHEYHELSAVLKCLPIASNDSLSIKNAVDTCDTIVVYGDDSTIEKVRLISTGKNFLPNGNMASFGFIDSEALSRERIDETATLAAYDVAMYDQQGCLSPHAYFVEADYKTASAFAKKLFEKLESLENRVPIGRIPADRQFLLRKFIEDWRLKSLMDKRIRMFQRKDSVTNSVILDPSPETYLSPNFRVVLVKPVVSVPEMLRSLLPFQKRIKGLSTTSSPARLENAIKSCDFLSPEIITGHGDLQYY
ncbi:MAG: hypothetical protein FJ088_07150, partial [Deltaproteobacteria bacterium]|nr:hypothetical protein [Deltaproteobacteria bacterium]